MKIQRYRHENPLSYALGMTLTFELLRGLPGQARQVFISPQAEQNAALAELEALCAEKNIPVEAERSEKAFNILSPKGNCFVIGVFEKFENPLKEGRHIVLVNPSDAGNLGTILRTALGFGLPDIAVVRPAVDLFDPKVVRASMGAVFHTRFAYFDAFADYQAQFPARRLYPFMLQASRPLGEVRFEAPYSLIFGNEAAGLPDCFAELPDSQPVIIPHSHAIDSLNLPMAAGIAMYAATRDDWIGQGSK